MIRFKKLLKYVQKEVTDDQPIANYWSSQQIYQKKATKVKEKSFNLGYESKKSVNLAQSYVHLKIAKNDQTRDTRFFDTLILKRFWGLFQ